MKQFLILCALILMPLLATAQKKEYKVEDDGFEWYKIEQTVGGKSREGAQDKYGNTIVSPQYYIISYKNGFFEVWDENSKHGLVNVQGQLIIPIEYDLITVSNDSHWKNSPYISVWKGDYKGVYNIYGKCIIPVSRRYKAIVQQGGDENKSDFDESKIYYQCGPSYGEKGIVTLCDASGKPFFTSRNEYCGLSLFKINSGKFCLYGNRDCEMQNGIRNFTNCVFLDLNENVLLGPFYKADLNYIIDKKGDEKRTFTQAEQNKILLNANPLSGNHDYFASLKAEASQQQNTAGNQTASGSSSSSSSSNSSTQTIIVEQHGPVQVWMQCGGCNGSGQCSLCFGQGRGNMSNGSCFRCGWSGKCNVCAGRGGHYETQYR